jgi:hypothetical protein
MDELPWIQPHSFAFAQRDLGSTGVDEGGKRIDRSCGGASMTMHSAWLGGPAPDGGKDVVCDAESVVNALALTPTSRGRGCWCAP